MKQRIEFKILLSTFKALNNGRILHNEYVFYANTKKIFAQVKYIFEVENSENKIQDEHFQSLLLHYGIAYLIAFVTRRSLTFLNLGKNHSYFLLPKIYSGTAYCTALKNIFLIDSGAI